MSLSDAKTTKNQEFTDYGSTPRIHMITSQRKLGSQKLSTKSFLPSQESDCKLERGSVIVWILVMIALLAALYYTFSSGFRSGESQLSREKAELYATEILDYAQSIKQAVQTLQINGCDETEISFEANNNSGYANPNSPPDNSCHVFHPNGGGLNYNPSPFSLKPESNDGINFVTSNGRAIPDIAQTDKSDLYLRISFRGKSYEPCNIINEKNDVFPEGGLPEGAFDPRCEGNIGYSGAKFTGSFFGSATSFASEPQTHGKHTFCVGTGADRMHFHHVLIAR